MQNPRIRWLTPDKPENISVGRERIANHLRDRGYQITVTGTTIETVRTAWNERSQFDVVLGTTRAGALAGSILSQITRKPFVVDHVDPIRQFRETNTWPLAVAVQIGEDGTFWASDTTLYVYEEESERVHRYADRVIKTDLGVDFERFANPPASVMERANSVIESLDLAENVAIYIGGLEPIYHIPELLDAVTQLSNWSLVVAGDGTLADDVREADAEREAVQYVGTVPHELVPGYLHAADVGVSLVDDPYTLKVLEYGAAGLQVVQAAGRAETRFGDRVEYCSLEPEDIAVALERAAHRDESDSLYEFVPSFDWNEIAEDYDRALKNVL